ncbi:MAG: flagellar filament capping protein FliD [Novosphingobium sp.]|nr:flagellar filament capping protein FliD [Novosphingobium sp.]
MSGATSSLTQSLVTALGAGSGIDMAALAQNLALAQFAPKIDRLAARSERLDRQISAASELRGMLLSLATSLGDRIRMGDLSPQPRIANAAVAKGSLSGSAQPRGSYALVVTALAAAQTLASPAYAAATDPVGAGTLTLRFGTLADGGFTEDPDHPPVNIVIASGSSLKDVAAAINGSGAGITAYIANTLDGARLVLKGQTGLANGFILEAVETPGEEGLANLAWNPAGDQTRLLASARDAAFAIDGLPMRSTGNRIVDAIPGVTLELTGTNSGAPTSITFENPATAITQTMQDLTAALNEIAAALRTATDPQTGELARDSGARGLARSFSRLAGTVIMPTAPDGAPRTLADLGLSTQRDGSFALDGARLASTLARDPQGAAAMFTTGLFGVYATIDKLSRSASIGRDPGSLAGSISRYSEQKRTIAREQSELAEKQEEFRLRMAERFAVSDSRIGAYKSTLTFLENQIAIWNKPER